MFGETQTIELEYPVRIIEIFSLFFTKEHQSAGHIFLEAQVYLKDDFNILLNGRNIEGFNGINTIINENAELSFFPKIGGG